MAHAEKPCYIQVQCEMAVLCPPKMHLVVNRVRKSLALLWSIQAQTLQKHPTGTYREIGMAKDQELTGTNVDGRSGGARMSANAGGAALLQQGDGRVLHDYRRLKLHYWMRETDFSLVKKET